MALLTGDLTITGIEDGAWQRDDVKEMIAKTSAKGFKPERPELNFDPQQPDRIVIESRNGSQVVEVPYPLGSPQKPMSETRHLNKFQLNAGLDDTDARDLWNLLRAWPRADNIHSLLAPLPVKSGEKSLRI